jgi:prepilin-type N-terminal cleavage/methylation domain-containing protein
MKRKQTGFTLVEIAIVLVIIGLLLGGILKGQEMITQAKIKNAITDFSGVSAAYFGYLDRYRATPGDDNGAVARWTLTAGQQGNGDRVLNGLYSSTTADDESRLWWLHLRRSGFVSGSGQDQPTNAFAGLIGVQTGNGASPPVANGLGFTGLFLCSTNLPDKVAIALDVQMDDAAPNNGAVRATLAAANPTIDAAVVQATSYVETGTNTYTLCRSF